MYECLYVLIQPLAAKRKWTYMWVRISWHTEWRQSWATIRRS